MLLPCWSTTHHHTHLSRHHTHLSLLCWPWWGVWWWRPLHCSEMIMLWTWTRDHPIPTITSQLIRLITILIHHSTHITATMPLHGSRSKMVSRRWLILFIKIHLQVTQKLIDLVYYKSWIESTMTILFNLISVYTLFSSGFAFCRSTFMHSSFSDAML